MTEGTVRRGDDCPCRSGLDRFACPCCRFLTLEVDHGTAEDQICPVCFWQHDHVDEADPDRPPRGPNRVSLTQARRNFATFGACERRFVRHVRDPRPDERVD